MGVFMSDSASPSDVMDVTSGAKQKQQRASFPVTDDDRIDLSKTSEASRERLRKMLNDPQLRAELGGGPVLAVGHPSVGPTPQVNTALVPPLYGVIGRALVTAATWRGFRPDLAERALTFTPEETAELSPPTAMVINRQLERVGAGAYSPEVTLAGTVLVAILGKFMLLASLQRDATTSPSPAQTM
jgi:hypothetical protein